MNTPPPQRAPLTVRVAQPAGEETLQAAEQSLLASQHAARKALEVISAYEAKHGEEPLSR